MQKQRQKKKKIQAKSTELTPHLRKVIQSTSAEIKAGRVHRFSNLDDFFKSIEK